MIKLLHVEGDADNRSIAKISLGLSAKFEVVQCGSGQDALGVLKEFNPDVILMEAMLPEMTGKQTLARIRETHIHAKTPAVFLTAHTQPAELEELRSIGAADVISKPFDALTLGEQIIRVLG